MKQQRPSRSVLPALAASLAMAVAAVPAVAATNDAKTGTEATKGGASNPCAATVKCKKSNNPCAASGCKKGKASNPCAGN